MPQARVDPQAGATLEKEPLLFKFPRVSTVRNNSSLILKYAALTTQAY